jgi:uncharacterized protein YegP (UPF0339 family)
MNPRFLLKPSRDGQLHFVLEAANGEPILSSETYPTKSAALKGIAAVKANAPIDERYQRKTATDGSPHFVLVAANNEPVATSETYSDATARDRGIAAVKAVAPAAEVEEES